MHHGHGARVLQVQQIVAVAHGIQRVGNSSAEPQQLRGTRAIQRVRGACQRRGSKRVCVRGSARGLKTGGVARKHPEVRQHVMTKQNGLRMLQVRIARHNHVHVGFRNVRKHTAQLVVGLQKLVAQVFCQQADVGGNLVVARAAGVKPRARGSNALGKHALYGHVAILVVYVPHKRARLDFRRYLRKAVNYGNAVLVRNYALLGKHGGVRNRPADVLLCHVLVDFQRRAELLRKSVDAALEPAAPQCHVASSVRS